MGSLGLSNKPLSKTDKYTVFKSYNGSMKWFANPDLSNSDEWHTKLLTPAERKAIEHYTGSGYYINDELYNVPWEQMSAKDKKEATNIYNGLSKFELNHGITVTRQCGFQIFGGQKGKSMSVEEVKAYLSNSKGVLQHDGFMSFGANSTGVPINSSGVVISLRIPPSVGAGAYVNTISLHSGKSENEFLLNNNSVIRYDMDSIKMVNGKVHVDAYWIGQAKTQTISSTNKSILKKK